MLVGYRDFSFFVGVVRDFGLLDFERNFSLFVTRYKPSVLQAIEKVFDRGVFGVNIEQVDSAERKADMRHSIAFFFSASCFQRLLRFVTFNAGVR